MNIRNPEIHQGSFWDWTFLNDVFAPTKIRVSDIDGVVERNGYCLYYETKRPDSKIPMGQDIMHRNWAARGDAVLRIWGIENEPQYAELLYTSGRTTGIVTRQFKNCSLDTIKSITAQWFKHANQTVK